MADQIFASIPWLVLLVVFVGEKVQQWFITRALDQALRRAQLAPPVTPVVPPQIVPARPVLPPPAPAVPAAAPAAGPFSAAPPWFTGALHEVGFHETGNNQGIGRYIAMAHCGADGDAWCSIFANAMLEQAGIPGTRSASSQSFRTHPAFVQLQGPALGAIAVYWRGARDSGLGHVGFYRGEDASHVWTLGGNENDMVQIEALPKDSASFGLIGYWWPKGVPLPSGGPVAMPSGSPVHIQTPPENLPSAPVAAPQGQHTNIVATYFGGPKSAYGGPIDDNKPGVALPFRFEGERPRVRVTRNGQSIDCDIVDVGPWNTHDPYWQTGTRPQAETGTDMTGRHTNKAGIDLTLAAAKALGVDGKAIVSWEFITGPLATTPNVI